MSEDNSIPIARRKLDPLTSFCEELSHPLEELFGLMYLAAHTPDKADSNRLFNLAGEKLSGIREVVLAHCSNPAQRKAS